jgi:hypothetical protein
MWARICEILLGIWLIVSHALFRAPVGLNFALAILIVLFALLSYIPSINKLHLLQVLPAAILLAKSYMDPSADLPLFMQNDILVGLSLLLFAVIPSHASDHPRSWKRYFEKGDH